MCFFSGPEVVIRDYPLITLALEGGGRVKQILTLANKGGGGVSENDNR